MTLMFCLVGLIMSGTAFGGGGGQCEDNGDRTVTDNGTGLMWQKATAGEMDWDQAKSYASGLSLGGHSDWQLPDVNELKELYQSPCKDMMEVLSDSDGCYWSSTSHAYSTSYAWLLNFNNGNMAYNNKSSIYYVRAVRSAQ